MPSPYPWRYAVRWPYYFCRPSTRNHTGLMRHPMSHAFVPDPGEQPLRLFFIGDIMSMHGDRVPKIDPALAELLRGADQVVGNCEAPVLRRPLQPDVRRSFVFNMSEAYLRGVVEQLGVPVERLALSMANNHAGDQGLAGWASTQECFHRLGITPLGRCGREASPLVSVKRKGLTLGLLAWTHWMNVEVFHDQPGVWRAEHVDGLNLEEVRQRHEVDLLVAFPHWEYEFQHFPREETRRRGASRAAGWT
jgi:poly-gamma-glutamate capsule biosynthesis protein CapA/YwtB (metallophosphatase superfamily)